MRATSKHAPRGGAILLGVGLAALSACTFDATNPAAITEPDLNNPATVNALVQGVVGDYDYSYHRSVLYSGLLSDEIRSSGTYNDWRNADVNGVVDAKSTSPGIQNISTEWWGRLHRARALAERAAVQIPLALPLDQQKPLLALTRLYAGMAYRDIGEYFCAAAYDAGPLTERAQSLALARTRLTESLDLAQEAKVDSVAHAARLMRARVNLSLGDLDAALADARAVPAGFVWWAHYRSSAHESNETVTFMNEQGLATVQQEFWSTGDPRVPVKANGKGADGVTLRYDQQKYGKLVNVAVGKWQEARLIEAEILLGRGDAAGAVALINQVRVAAKVAPVSAGLSVAQATEALRAERKHEFFLEGQRMLDMRRWGLFPAGWQAGCAPIPASQLVNNTHL